MQLRRDGDGTVTLRRGLLINYGSSTLPERIVVNGARILNNPAQVKAAGNKLSCFQALQGVEGVTIPEWTVDREVADGWVKSGSVVLARNTLTGHSGEGIVVISPENLTDPLPRAPLYVRYVKKRKEFRVHVGNGQVFDVQEKRRNRDYDGDPNNLVRNHQNGWVYCREDIEEPTAMRQMAIQAVLTLGLDFGAVDIIWNGHFNQCFVLEVNTAPGLEGTTLRKYTELFMEYVNE